MEVLRFTVLAALALVAAVNGQNAQISLTATNSINYLYVDDIQHTPLPNFGSWRDIDTLPVDNHARLISIRANNVIGGCSGLMVALQNHEFGYELLSNAEWKCNASPAGNSWLYLGYDDSTWLPAHEVGRNGVTSGCPWIPLGSMPQDAFWIWTPAFTDGDMVVSCRGYTPVCDHSPCQNGGVCNRNAPDLCTCPVRWGGRFCELPVDECESNPCQHGGLCQQTDFGYSCTCGIGYTGTHCETDITDCGSNPCQHGGTCIFELPEGYQCNCVPGYNGPNCENDIDECEENPCQNGATCHDEVNGVDCECVPGYTGVLCQTNFNECASNPCRNGGQCLDELNGYQCDCYLGYEGDHCETGVGECATSPCQNGGTCTLEGPGGSVDCVCPPGWYGPLCESSEDECLSNPCKNNGRCVDGDERFDCICSDEFTGVLCDTVTPHCGDMMAVSNYAPSRNFWNLCEINIIDHPQYTDMSCTDLIAGIPYYNDSATIIALGGTYGCYPTKYPEEMPNGACIPDYNQNAALGKCLSCTHMGVCIDAPPPK